MKVFLVEANYSKDDEELAVYTYKYVGVGSELIYKSNIPIDAPIGKHYYFDLTNQVNEFYMTEKQIEAERKAIRDRYEETQK